jgi:GNAT superfamily N-acetyltransferase
MELLSDPPESATAKGGMRRSQVTSDMGRGLSELEHVGHASFIESIGVFARLPGGVSGDRPGLAWRIIPLPIPYLNLVIAQGRDDAEVDAGIEVLTEHAVSRPSMLFLGPFGPSRLAEVTARACIKGLVPQENEPLMTAAIADLAPVQTTRFTVMPVESREDAETWGEVCAAAFQVPVEHFALWIDAIANARSELRQHAVHLLVRLDSHPAATVVLIKGAGLGGIYAVGTVPALRGKGAGAAATLAASHRAAEWGCTHVTLQATQAGLPVYTRLGFRSHGDYAVFMTS